MIIMPEIEGGISSSIWDGIIDEYWDGNEELSLHIMSLGIFTAFICQESP